MPSILTPDQMNSYVNDGYVIVRSLFDDEEIGLLRRSMEEDPAIRGHFYDRQDTSGTATKMALWNHPGDSVYGLAARSERVVETMEQLLGGEVYHYHSKLTAKEPRVGGAWEWHQDYGYWYDNGCLFPLMASMMIALDHTNAENGCLQVLRGSHNLGRIDHKLLEGEQVGADLERVEQAKKHLETVYVEMEPGDALFFHCNTLHRSDQNRSDNRRWTLLCCFNAARNDPYLEHHHPGYTKLEKVSNDAIKQAGLKFATADETANFMSTPEAPPGMKDQSPAAASQG